MAVLRTEAGKIDKEARLLDFLSATFGGSEKTSIDSFLAPGATFCGSISQGVAVPVSEWLEFSSVLQEFIGPSYFYPINKIEQGDWISLRVDIRTDCLASGNSISTLDCMHVRFDGERIAEFIGHTDYLTLFENLGLVPSGALHACLSGQKLTWE